jgi:hypothetical protein
MAFHLPLTATTAVMMLGSPIVGAALARAPQSILSLAAWQVAQSLLWLHRTVVFALPEVVITLYRDASSALMLRRFSLSVGLVSSVLVGVVTLLGLDTWFFTVVLQESPKVAAAARIAYLAGALLPFVGAMQSYVRGMLTAHHLTLARFGAVLVSLGCAAFFLWLTVVVGIAGVVSAAIALTISLIAELAFLIYAWRRGRSTTAAPYPIG